MRNADCGLPNAECRTRNAALLDVDCRRAAGDLHVLLRPLAAGVYSDCPRARRHAVELEAAVAPGKRRERRRRGEDRRRHRRMDIAADAVEAVAPEGVLVGAAGRNRDVERLLARLLVLD